MPNVPTVTMLCPMCGQSVAITENDCPACGEPIQKVKLPVIARDRMLSYLSGGITTLITGGMLVNWIMLERDIAQHNANQIEQHHAALASGIMMGLTFVVSAWLWAPPLIRVAIHDPKAYGKEKVPSRWRLFWQTQLTMYALSVALVLLCLVTCATR